MRAIVRIPGTLLAEYVDEGDGGRVTRLTFTPSAADAGYRGLAAEIQEVVDETPREQRLEDAVNHLLNAFDARPDLRVAAKAEAERALRPIPEPRLDDDDGPFWRAVTAYLDEGKHITWDAG